MKAKLFVIAYWIFRFLSTTFDKLALRCGIKYLDCHDNTEEVAQLRKSMMETYNSL